ncbi:MAG: hypothetical protein RDV48_29525 [Candidatus Eremiobacteraeota bacterium]|nr:hypothetical protein [Candidatus Eremiobacteraeota bacterium]
MKSSSLKILIVVTVIFVFAVSVTSLVMSYEGGGKSTGGKHQGCMLDRMKSDLGLTDAQAGQLKTLMEKNRAERMAEREEMSARVRTVLTPEQQKLWDSSMAERKGKMRGCPKDSAGSEKSSAKGENCKKGKGFMSGLNLTEVQKEKISSIKSEEKAKGKALKESRTKELQKILTPEQYKKFEAKKKEHQGKGGMHHRGGKGNCNSSPDSPNKGMK